MYLPPAFSTDQPTAEAIIRAYPFASLVSVHQGEVMLTQIPVLQASATRLIAHMARANPHGAALLGASESTPVVLQFTGPNAYVSPAWYEKNTGVPTWNYATVRVQGILKVLHGAAATEAVVKRLIEHFDAQPERVKQAWADSPAAAQAAQLAAIVAFEIEIVKIQAKTKLSQNRPASDQLRVRSQLLLGSHAEQEVAAMMQSV